jgi:hypothetical protein
MAKHERVTEDDNADAFDEHGLLKDGKTFRVPMRLMDKADREWLSEMEREMKDRQTNKKLHDGLGGPVGNRPGFIVIDDNVADKERRDAYDGYSHDLQKAWRADDASTYNIEHTIRPKDNKTVDERTNAYLDYDSYVSNCWRGPGR